MRKRFPLRTVAWVRGFFPALMLSVCSLWGQGTIVFRTPQEPISYGPVTGSYSLDLNGDGNTEFTLSYDISGARLSPGAGNKVIWDTISIAAINRGELISGTPSSINPYYQWFMPSIPGDSASLGGQAVFDGQYFYSGNFSGKDAYIGLEFEVSGKDYFGWLEVNNYTDIAAGQVLGWAYETVPNTPLFAGEVPEPGTGALFIFGALILRRSLYRMRSK